MMMISNKESVLVSKEKLEVTPACQPRKLVKFVTQCYLGLTRSLIVSDYTTVSRRGGHDYLKAPPCDATAVLNRADHQEHNTYSVLGSMHTDVSAHRQIKHQKPNRRRNLKTCGLVQKKVTFSHSINIKWRNSA